MNNKKNKKISPNRSDSELFNRFFSDNDARQLEDDTQWTSQRFQDASRPRLAPEKLAELKAAVHTNIRKQKSTNLVTAKKVIFAAAVFLIAALLSLAIFDTTDQPAATQTAAVDNQDATRQMNPHSKTNITRAPEYNAENTRTVAANSFWQDQGLTDDIAYINAEIENIEDSIESVRFGETQQDTNLDYIDIEIEFLESNGMFWKG